MDESKVNHDTRIGTNDCKTGTKAFSDDGNCVDDATSFLLPLHVRL